LTKQELAAKIWSTANTLRKNIKASEYKDYILGFMFYKYLSDKEEAYLATIGGESPEDIKNADKGLKEKFRDYLGYFISYDNLFSTWKKDGLTLGAKTVSEALEDFYRNLNDAYRSVFAGIFSALERGVSKLGENAGSRDKAVRDIVSLVDLIPPTSRDYDVLGYIYEYLIQQFSSEAKKDGAFYTPHELTDLMSRILAERMKGRTEVRVYDPTVGSAGLLLNIGRAVGKYVDRGQIRYYGQELITETANLAKMNLFMQGVPVQNICIRNANTLEEDWPYFDENTPYEPVFVDAVVSNPPYSARWSPEHHKTDERFRAYGLAPEGKADYAFLLHCLYHVKPDGVMAIVLPHGVLFRGDAEGEIRKNLIQNHNIETIIGLPANLFFATGIPVIVMILSKNRAAGDVLFIDASRLYRKDKKQNVLRESDVRRIFDAVQARTDIPHFAHLAGYKEIAGNGYNLNIPRYVSAAPEPVPDDLYSVMTGDVSGTELGQFADFWHAFPRLSGELFQKTGNYYRFRTADIRETIAKDADVIRFRDEFARTTDTFRAFLTRTLLEGTPDARVLDTVTDHLFSVCSQVPLVDRYALYQALMDAWPVIDADLSRIRAEGRDTLTETGQKDGIIPPALVRSVCFADKEKEIGDLLSEADRAASDAAAVWDDMDEEAKAGLAKDGSGAFDAGKLRKAAKEGSFGTNAAAQVKRILSGLDREKTLRRKAKDAGADLEKQAEEKLKHLTDDEVKRLLARKWIDPVIDGINRAAEQTLADFADALSAIQKKYADPLDAINRDIERENAKLKDMMGRLTGPDDDLAAIRMLMEDL